MKKSKPSVFVYMLAYLAIALRWMRRSTVGKVVTAGLLILLVSGTYNQLSAAPFFADKAQPKLTETEKADYELIEIKLIGGSADGSLLAEITGTSKYGNMDSCE